MIPQALFYESMDEALTDAVHAAGGPKVVGAMLWPDKDPQEAGKFLNRCLSPDRSEKLELSQWLFIMRKARDVDCHIPMAFLCDYLDYESPTPKNPDTERDRLQREFVAAKNEFSELLKRMERLGGGS